MSFANEYGKKLYTCMTDSKCPPFFYDSYDMNNLGNKILISHSKV